MAYLNITMPTELYDVEFVIDIPEVTEDWTVMPQFKVSDFKAKVHSDTVYEIKRTFITTY